MREGCISNKIYLFCHCVLLSFFPSVSLKTFLSHLYVSRCPVAYRPYPGSVITGSQGLKFACTVKLCLTVYWSPSKCIKFSEPITSSPSYLVSSSSYLRRSRSLSTKVQILFPFSWFSTIRSELHWSTSVTGSLVPIYCRISVHRYSTAVDTSVRCGYVSLDSRYNALGCICKVPGEVHGAACRIVHGATCRIAHSARCRIVHGATCRIMHGAVCRVYLRKWSVSQNLYPFFKLIFLRIFTKFSCSNIGSILALLSLQRSICYSYLT